MKSSAICLLIACAATSPPLYAVDAVDANDLLKASKCLNCHSVDKNKDGPAYAEVAKTYRDDPEAVGKLTDWVSSEHTVEIDGEDEDHPAVKTKDAARIANLVAWILSR
jgi:cytochrome c